MNWAGTGTYGTHSGGMFFMQPLYWHFSCFYMRFGNGNKPAESLMARRAGPFF